MRHVRVDCDGGVLSAVVSIKTESTDRLCCRRTVTSHIAHHSAQLAVPATVPTKVGLHKMNSSDYALNIEWRHCHMVIWPTNEMW